MKKRKPIRPAAQARGIPRNKAELSPLGPEILNAVFDGAVWEIAPTDHSFTPRRLQELLRNHVAQAHIRAMIDKRDHYIYVQRLDADHNPADREIRALNGRRPELARWLLPVSETPEPETPTEESPQPHPETETAVRPPVRESKTNVPARKLEPFVLACMNRYFEHGLMVTEVARVVEKLIIESGHETRLVNRQQLAICLNDLVADPDTLLFRRLTGNQEFPGLSIGSKGAYLYSATDPVPRWDAQLHGRLLREYPDLRLSPGEAAVTRPSRDEPENDHEESPAVPPRIVIPRKTLIEQPTYRVTTAAPELLTKSETAVTPTLPQPVANGHASPFGEQVSRIMTELQALVSTAEAQANGDEKLHAEIEELKQQNRELAADLSAHMKEAERLGRERDSAVAQLQAVARAQRTIQEALGIVGTTG